MSKAVGRQTVLLNKAKKKLISAEKRKILDEVRVSRWNTKNEQGSASAGSTPFRGTAHRIGDDLEQKYACLDELHKMKRVFTLFQELHTSFCVISFLYLRDKHYKIVHRSYSNLMWRVCWT